MNFKSMRNDFVQDLTFKYNDKLQNDKIVSKQIQFRERGGKLFVVNIENIKIKSAVIFHTFWGSQIWFYNQLIMLVSVSLWPFVVVHIIAS